MQSKPTARWEGDLMSGKGATSAASGALRDAKLTWKARTEGAAGMTTPEELLAAAHASCYAMALSGGLGRGGTPPQRLEVTATVRLATSWRVELTSRMIVSMSLSVSAYVRSEPELVPRFAALEEICG